MCAEACLVKLGAVVDGTKVGANASVDLNRTAEELTKQIAKILAEAAELDAAEDAAENAAATGSGQELPVSMVDPALRRAELAAPRQRQHQASGVRGVVERLVWGPP